MELFFEPMDTLPIKRAMFISTCVNDANQMMQLFCIQMKDNGIHAF